MHYPYGAGMTMQGGQAGVFSPMGYLPSGYVPMAYNPQMSAHMQQQQPGGGHLGAGSLRPPMGHPGGGVEGSQHFIQQHHQQHYANQMPHQGPGQLRGGPPPQPPSHGGSFSAANGSDAMRGSHKPNGADGSPK